MSFVTRHLLPTVLVGVAVLLLAGFFVFARPQHHPPNQGEQITAPPEHPATGWTWAEGTPGWKAGTMLGKHHDFNVSGVQPVEIAVAQLTAAHAMLDAEGLRVLDAIRVDTSGPVAILAAPALDVTPTETCVAVMLRGGAPVNWRCPRELAGTHVLGAMVAGRAPAGSLPSLFVMGVASGDVQRIVVVAASFRTEAYTRGTTWGQFMTSLPPAKSAQLLVYGDHGLLQKLTLSAPPSGQRLFD
ncbi:MAG: hypothetical protein ACJ757_00445 [Gaiellaceae bacterium]